jgi:hypothetical protein
MTRWCTVPVLTLAVLWVVRCLSTGYLVPTQTFCLGLSVCTQHVTLDVEALRRAVLLHRTNLEETPSDPIESTQRTSLQLAELIEEGIISLPLTEDNTRRFHVGDSR